MSKVRLEDLLQLDLNILKEETNIIIFPDGQLFYGDISHDMLIYNTVREHDEYSDILYEIKDWINRFEDSDASCWGYCGIILGHDFAIRHNIVKIYGVDTFREDFLLCNETTHSLTTPQIKVLYEIRELFSSSQRCVIERWYDTEVNKNEN